MNSRERFLAAMAYQPCDHPPLFEEGIRPAVLRAWRRQGFTRAEDYGELLAFDRREEIEPDLDPRPALQHWPEETEALSKIAWRYDPADRGRLPGNWGKLKRAAARGDMVIMLRAHRGFFLSMGVDGWKRFRQVALLSLDRPEYIAKVLSLQGELAASLAERILGEIRVDAAIFSEPISGNHGPLISPGMYQRAVLPHYQPVLDVFRRHGVETLIIRTYANSRPLLPALIAAGFNCLWACECPQKSMDYLAIRQEFGPALRLIGGVDTDALRSGSASIDRQLAEVVAPLLEQGGFIPLLDGRVRQDIPFENYAYYRK
ncbi:MAG: uroporphyrinogen decarboxylase family protein, partial [Anaerolineales bacterium]|nr:uroporphyrinogen decarboxylase family protein [Anaerolineales bacterium]